MKKILLGIFLCLLMAGTVYGEPKFGGLRPCTDAEMTAGTVQNCSVTPANAKVELDKTLKVANNLSDVTAATARTNLGLAIGTNVQAYNANLQAYTETVSCGGTADALTPDYATNITLTDGQRIKCRATAANATTTPTIAPDGLTARTITKLGGVALVVGDIKGALHELDLIYNLANTRWELQNPANPGGAAADNSTVSTATETHFLKKHTDGTIADQLIVDMKVATFDGGGSPILINKTTNGMHIPYAMTVNQWVVECDVNSGGQGIIITPYMDAYGEDTLPTTTMCTTGTAPHTSNSGTGQKVHKAAWTVILQLFLPIAH
jgi:hypothetical protein